MKKGFIVLALMLLGAIPGLADAAVQYVRSGASGNGSSWSNAYGQLPATLVRGDTYYIAAGSYGGRTFNDAQSGSTYIYIKKATAADHGTDTGWSSAYAGTATFGSLVFSKGYYDIDGKVGGGPGSFTSGHGFKIATAASGLGKVITINNVTGIRIRHAEIYFNNLGTTGQVSGLTATGDLIYAISGGSDLLVQYCWLHDSARTIFYPINWSNITFEYNRIERNGVNWSSSNHSELFSSRQVSNVTVRYNYILDWKSTGGLIFGGVVSSAAASTSSNIYIYGNIFEWTKNWGNTANDGVIGGWNHSWMYVKTVRIFNNTFVNITDSNPSDAASIFPIISHLSDVVVQNNIWYNANPRIINGSHNYNWFNSNSHSESNAQVSSSNPFVNYSGKNYKLSTATAGGATLSAPYNFDMDNVSRGQDGNWDRGAYEFGGTSSNPVPSSPKGLTVN
ncbi:MAG TPA: hypothetical protein DDW94_10490 [Deltaproteobacteria bacterium]|nr:MAG: hypothetical protein A2Z79_11885 [Deltaproteobacteria bacterium GWA2_55_82]OGQ63567.1 MAG: hypothetical protein A3I81_06075 [Deltaproteobacteria bacterium RIFCSPLOWO2_02_FULL_55_12]OIJ74949.1 MAG: hypothetical protein A2V21_312135 [Deltaproteobacteria bacterium GWC2_55_46]HBG47397.1 hypothetical protein [Deltaproteobacteria bacterium]HCY11413.1 hypothetical protein [Deltaproteobacteria bacterium]